MFYIGHKKGMTKDVITTLGGVNNNEGKYVFGGFPSSAGTDCCVVQGASVLSGCWS